MDVLVNPLRRRHANNRFVLLGPLGNHGVHVVSAAAMDIGYSV